MGMIKIYAGKSKPAKKKPGWREAEAEHEAWLKKINSATLFNPGVRPKMQHGKKIDPVVRTPLIDPERSANRHPSRQTFGGAATKPVPRPDIQYRNDPVMLARELDARSRKFNVAPLYNKAAAQFISDDEIKTDLKHGLNRRR